MDDNFARNVNGWRAFFSLIFISCVFSGVVRPPSATGEACSVGALGAAIYAIFIANKYSFWAILWRLYLAFIGTALVVGSLNHGSSGGAFAFGASLLGGVFIIPPGVALFYWDNLATKIIFYFLAGCMVLGILMSIF